MCGGGEGCCSDCVGAAVTVCVWGEGCCSDCVGAAVTVCVWEG